MVIGESLLVFRIAGFQWLRSGDGCGNGLVVEREERGVFEGVLTRLDDLAGKADEEDDCEDKRNEDGESENVHE